MLNIVTYKLKSTIVKKYILLMIKIKINYT